MAFINYAHLVPIGIKAIVNFARALHNKKADDGKVDFAELMECFGEMWKDVYPVAEPYMRDEDKDDE